MIYCIVRFFCCASKREYHSIFCRMYCMYFYDEEHEHWGFLMRRVVYNMAYISLALPCS